MVSRKSRKRIPFFVSGTALGIGVLALGWLPARGQIAVKNQGFVPFSDEPINYRTAKVSAPVAKLQERMDRGEVKLEYAGFAAPASGEFNLELKQEFTSTIEKLLAEKVGDQEIAKR